MSPDELDLPTGNRTPSPALDGLLQAAARRQLLAHDRIGPMRDRLIEAETSEDIRRILDRLAEAEAPMLRELLPDDDHLLTAPYVRHACLGQGRVGTTWIGQGPDGRRVAIKIVHAQRVAPGPAAELLVRDVKPLVNAVLHYLVPYRAAYLAADGRAILVSDYVAGRDLAQRAQIKGAQSEPRALVTLRQVTKGLLELGKLGSLHGLIHPGNVILDQDHRARLSDYGLVFGRTLQSLREGFTPQDLLLHPWASPEQVATVPKLLPASDIYAVGCLAFWLLADQAPFTGRADQVINQHRGGPRPDVRRLAPDVSEITAKTILKCMQVEPNRRYGSPAELGRSLQRNLTNLLPDDEESGAYPAVAGDSGELPLKLVEPAPTTEVAPTSSALLPRSSERLQAIRPAEPKPSTVPAPPTIEDTNLMDLGIVDFYDSEATPADGHPPVAAPLTPPEVPAPRKALKLEDDD